MMDPPDPRRFATTRWSLVLAANFDTGDQIRAREALEKLCRAYWYPLYAFVRTRGYSADDAQDLTQAFFARILETGGFPSVDRDKGRFRSYLLGAMKHFLANDWHRARAQKRGGGVRLIEWDALDPERRYTGTSESLDDPEFLFDREWALETVSATLRTLRSEMARGGRAEQFETLKGCLTDEGGPSRAEMASRLGKSEGAVKVAIHRMRQRYRELLRAAVAETVGDEAELERELRHLVEVLRKT
jgi:RNA polymerase sigma-70 factor (ECF subfamily)